MRRKRSKRLTESDETCYMCDKVAINREHAPPLAFFPDDLRGNLITVPSCKTHNNDNSEDVEYVRNIIASDINANELAMKLFSGKILRSYKRNPKLTQRTFSRVREVRVAGMETAVVQTNNTKFNPIIRAIASALYFHDFGEKFRYHFRVHGATMLSENQGFLDLPDDFTPRTNALLRSVPTADRDTNQPEVFKYGVYRREEYSVIYRLVFYGGVDIYAFGTPPGSRLEQMED